MAPPLHAAVIGAGASGLATARALKLEGLEVTVFEKSNQLGGTWVYDPRTESDPLGLDPDREIIHSSLYASLTTNLPSQLMGFSDYPFTGSSSLFPGHKEVLDYLKRFADDFGLLELIRFESEVVRVERVGSRKDLWVVEFRKVGLVFEEVFDAVVVCNGHYSQPRLAQIPGIEKWPGKQIHSHNYRCPEPFRDQVVVVIGIGPSAMDISLEISNVAREVHISSRSPTIQIGKFGHGKDIWLHTKINCVYENGEVGFDDGALLHADVILHCTGYAYEFPFLKTDGIVSVDDNRVGPLYRHVFPPKLAPNLSFVGLTFKVVVFLGIDLQAKWVAKVLSGKAILASEDEMMADVERRYQHMKENGIPKHLTHEIGHQVFFEYADWLATQSGIEVDEELKSIAMEYLQFIVLNDLWKTKEWQPTAGKI